MFGTAQRSKNQRLINEALSLTTLEELSSMVMPIMPPTGWQTEKPWNKFLRDDVSVQAAHIGNANSSSGLTMTFLDVISLQLDTRTSYSQILTQHLQSANSELR